MTQLTLSRKLSIIHAVKCNKGTSFEIARQSSDKLYEFFNRLKELKEEDVENFKQEIDAWANANPIATEKDIKELITK